MVSPVQNIETTDYRVGSGGGCLVNGKQTCVWGPQDFCDPDTFVPAHVVRDRSSGSLHPFFYCGWDLLEKAEIGRCGDSGRCSNLAERCDNPSTWVERDTTCTIARDLKNTLMTPYGRCGTRCSWSEEDCMEGEAWTMNDPSCTSDKVEIGACFESAYFCVPTSAMCNTTEPAVPYYNYAEIRKKGINCFLAVTDIPDNSPNAPPVTRPPTVPQIQSPTPPSASAAAEDAPMPAPSDSSAGLSSGGLIGIILASAAVAGAILGALMVYSQKKRRTTLESAGLGLVDQGPPVKSLRKLKEVTIDDDEALSVAGIDDDGMLRDDASVGSGESTGVA